MFEQIFGSILTFCKISYELMFLISNQQFNKILDFIQLLNCNLGDIGR